jgi:hypothetical protein
MSHIRLMLKSCTQLSDQTGGTNGRQPTSIPEAGPDLRAGIDD